MPRRKKRPPRLPRRRRSAPPSPTSTEKPGSSPVLPYIDIAITNFRFIGSLRTDTDRAICARATRQFRLLITLGLPVPLSRAGHPMMARSAPRTSRDHPRSEQTAMQVKGHGDRGDRDAATSASARFSPNHLSISQDAKRCRSRRPGADAALVALDIAAGIRNDPHVRTLRHASFRSFQGVDQRWERRNSC